MSRRNTPQASGPTSANPYGEGAPHGDPFQVNTQATFAPIPPSHSNHPGLRHPSGHAEGPQMDMLVQMMQTLLQDTNELKGRVASIEARISSSTIPTLTRTTVAHRGRPTRSKTKATSSSRQGRTMDVSSDSDAHWIDPALADSSPDASADTDQDRESVADSDSFGSSNLTPTEHRALQGFISKLFRRVCDVPDGRWPDPELIRVNPTTNEIYPTPFFGVRVDEERNQKVFRVAEQAAIELQSFKSQWKEGQSDEAAARGKMKRTMDRRNKRRKQKATQINKVIERFAALYGIDPKALKMALHEQYLSDEVSGPEEESGETKAAWTVRLAAAAGKPLSPAALKNIHFLEVLVPTWRSDDYSTLIHNVEDFKVGESKPLDELNIKYTRVSLGRPSDRIPGYAPYDFGYKEDWLREARAIDATKNLVKDWGKYPVPDGCGLPMRGEVAGVDPRFDFSETDDNGHS
ncbi:hypothetical protein DFH07DRAFT_1022022 [Mycena maculata]|uniref:Uncharacterized protein n=1 Tax=Mycena maculata TaxID=230809 RepID=A0AAD7J9Y6_9AGAR|nr:hypothetical protein DFH07DRAFT_1022022 [Mycena maculata]